MGTIRVVRGTGTGPTAMASYDAALAAAGVHNYNLVAVSSVVPAGAEVVDAGTAPDLGPIGGRLTVVEARATAAGPCRVSACLGRVRRPDGAGLFYEAGGESRAGVERRVREGLLAGADLRDWETGDPSLTTASADAADGTYATAVVLAVYGDAEPVC